MEGGEIRGGTDRVRINCLGFWFIINGGSGSGGRWRRIPKVGGEGRPSSEAAEVSKA